MKFLKNWKLIVAAMTVALFTACAGSNGGASDEDVSSGESDAPAAAAASQKKAPPKEVIDENKLKKTEQEATALTEENHKLRKEIFEAKNKLGMSTATEDAGEAAAE